MFIPLLFALVYPGCLIWAAKSDIETMTIPNRLNMILAGAFLPTALLLGLGWEGWAVHIGLGVAGLVLGRVLFAFRLMGGGDAKLIAAAAVWLGLDGFVALILYTAIAGGVLTITLLGVRKLYGHYAGMLPVNLGRHLVEKGDIPYGVAICAGGLLAMQHSDILPLILKLS